VRDYLIYIRKFNTTFKESSYDLLHLVSSASISLIKDIVMLRLAKKRKIKTVVHFRFGRIPELSIKRNWEWKLICKVVALSDTAIVIDKASLETLQNAGYKNVVFLPNPVAPIISEIIEENIDKKRELRTLLFAGHGLKTKGIYELVDACSQMSNIKLKMIGTIQDDVKKELYEKVNDADWLEVCGEQPFKRVIEEMLSCDLFVLPTYTEGFPNVILESMACGCAIVTTPVGAIPEMLEEENGKHYGILVSPKNVEELKRGIEQMLNYEELKEECRKNVQQRVNERYNIDAVWKQMVNIWNNTISNNYEKN
jgi:glycosyltransferase involved in cell wall biosynthesis